jgi:hypothetical protein
MSLFPVGISYITQVPLVDPVSGWNLFAAAMTSIQGLRSDLISRVHTRASTSNIAGVFPLYYDSSNGTSLQGIAR